MDCDPNIDALLTPISPERPSGEDLRYTEVHDQIKEARRTDDLLAQGEWRTDVKTSDWRKVIQLCSDALTERSKDLQVAVWLTEALLQQQGYGGLANGIELVHRLIEDFWPTLHPLMDDGDMEYRIGPLALLNEKLPGVLCQVPVCDPECSRGYHYYQWEESRLVGFNQGLDKEQRKRRELLIEEGKISGEDFSAAVNAGSLVFYQNAVAQLARCREALDALDAVVTEKCSPNPPGFRQLMEAIDKCAHLVERIYNDKQKSEVPPDDDPVAAPPSPAGDSAAPQQGVADEIFDLALNDSAVIQRNAISDITLFEKGAWKQVLEKLSRGRLRPALDQLLSAAALAPSMREKNRYLLLVAKLCLKARRPDLAAPIVEEIYQLIESLKLEQWEHPAWIAEVVETLYRCLSGNDEGESERSKTLFRKLCMLNVSKAAAYRAGA